MNENIIDESFIYEELGLLPLWIELPKKQLKKNELSTNLYIKKFVINQNTILLIAQIFNLPNSIELELFQKISMYIDTLSNKLTQPKSIKESDLSGEIRSSDYLMFLGDDISKQINKKENLNLPNISSISLKEMIENPEKKRKLWQDIKDLTNSLK